MARARFFLLAVFVSSIFATTAMADVRMEAIGFWNFDSDVDDAVMDVTGNGHDGELHNGPQWVEGKFGLGMECDGSDQGVMIDDADEFDFDGPFTMAAWILTDSKPAALLTKENAYGLHIHPDGVKWIVWGHDWRTGVQPTPNEWTHFVLIYDGSNRHIYKDGNQEGTQVWSAAIPNLANPVGLGRWDSINVEPMEGVMDELGLWDRVLNEEEISELIDPPAAVDARWKLLGMHDPFHLAGPCRIDERLSPAPKTYHSQFGVLGVQLDIPVLGRTGLHQRAPQGAALTLLRRWNAFVLSRKDQGREAKQKDGDTQDGWCRFWRHCFPIERMAQQRYSVCCSRWFAEGISLSLPDRMHAPDARQDYRIDTIDSNQPGEWETGAFWSHALPWGKPL